MKKKGTKKGFTLIELSFAILFISTLLLTVTLIASEIISIYRKGYAIKTINSVGRDLIDDFSASFTGATSGKLVDLCNRYESEPSVYNVCKNDGGVKFIFQQFEEEIESKTDRLKERTYPYGGIICTGQYSYIYQTGFLLNSELYEPVGANKIDRIKVKYNDSESITDFRLLKFSDAGRSLCTENLNDYEFKNEQELYSEGGVSKNRLVITIPNTLSEDPVELLASSDTKLALFNVNIPLPAQTSSTGKALYSASFILATISGGVDIKTNNNYCTAPDYYSSDFSYCAINKFNFSIQANGGGKK